MGRRNTDAQDPGRVAKAPRPGLVELAGLALVLALFALGTRGHALVAPFFSDDFSFLAKTRDSGILDLIAARDLAYHWYRPWSRELHFAAIQRAFGAHPLPFHIACFALWVTAMLLYFTLVRRIAGATPAAFALAGVVSLAAWGVPLEWGPGAQDLWMLVFALSGLHAFARRRTAIAMAFVSLALLSKEPAAVLPLIAWSWALWIDGERPWPALRRTAPLFALTLAWAILHPALGGRGWWAGHLPPFPAVTGQPATAAVRTLLSLVNLDLIPRGMSVIDGVRNAWPALLLLAFGFLRGRGGGDRVVSPAACAGFGATWFVLAALPLFGPSVIWQPYYVLFAGLGGWIAIAAGLDRHRAWLTALLVAVALLRAPRAATPAEEWGNEVLMRNGKRFVAETESFVRPRLRDATPHTRIYFAGVPAGSVFVLGPGDTPALSVWSRDTTLRGYYWSHFRVRSPSEPAGADRFLAYDERGWREVEPVGPPPAGDSRARDSWTSDRESLAQTLLDGGDIAGARRVYQALAAAHPERAAYAHLVGGCAELQGDLTGAARWHRRAASLPDADAEMRAKAAEFGDPR